MSRNQDATSEQPNAEAGDLVQAFQAHYQHFEQAIREAIEGSADSTVLARLGDDIDEYLMNEVSH